MAEMEAESTSDGRVKADLQTQAREYRRLARDARRDFAGTRHELRKYAQLIVATVGACAGQEEARTVVAKHQAAMCEGGGGSAKVAGVLDRVLAGERDAEVLCEGLGPEGSMIIETILQGISDPSTLEDLLPEQGQA